MEYNFKLQEKKWIVFFCVVIVAPFIIAMFLRANADMHREEIVSSGYVIIRGKLLRHPYKIVSDGENITINGEWYELEYEKPPLLNYWVMSHFKTAQLYDSRFDSLVNFMERGGLEIVFARDKNGSYSRSELGNSSELQAMIDNMNETINSDLPIDEKRKKIIETLDLSEYEYKYIDDFLNNWGS